MFGPDLGPGLAPSPDALNSVKTRLKEIAPAAEGIGPALDSELNSLLSSLGSDASPSSSDAFSPNLDSL